MHMSLPLMAVVMSVTSCQNGSEEVTNINGKANITFNVINYQQQGLDDVTTGEFGTRAAGDVSVLAHLALAVYDAEGNIYTTVEQNRGDDGYGTFSLNVPYGKYSFVFIGYDGSHAVQFNDPTRITFTDNYVPNCFCSTLTTTISDGANLNEQISLTRCVGCFSIRCSNGVPDDMMAMSYTTTGGGTALNPFTGFAASTTTRTGKIDFSNTTNRKNTQTANIYCFLPDNTATMTFNLSADREDGTPIRTRTFSDVPMKMNQRIYYTGDFFADDAAFTLTLTNADWDIVEETF